MNWTSDIVAVWDYPLTTRSAPTILSCAHTGGTHMKMSRGNIWTLSISRFADRDCRRCSAPHLQTFRPGPIAVTAFMGCLNVPNMTVRSATLVPAAAPNPEYCDVKGSDNYFRRRRGTRLRKFRSHASRKLESEIHLPRCRRSGRLSHLVGESRRPGARFWRKAMPPQSRTPVTW